MGAGDVKLLAGVGAWVWAATPSMRSASRPLSEESSQSRWCFWRGNWRHHFYQFLTITSEILEVRDPNALSAIAAERKSRMLLLPYGIPIAIGSIAYFLWMGMLL